MVKCDGYWPLWLVCALCCGFVVGCSTLREIRGAAHAVSNSVENVAANVDTAISMVTTGTIPMLVGWAGELQKHQNDLIWQASETTKEIREKTKEFLVGLTGLAAAAAGYLKYRTSRTDKKIERLKNGGT